MLNIFVDENIAFAIETFYDLEDKKLLLVIGLKKLISRIYSTEDDA